METTHSAPSENIGINLPTPIERDFDTFDQPSSSASEAFPLLQTDAHRDRSSAPSPSHALALAEYHTTSPTYHHNHGRTIENKLPSTNHQPGSPSPENDSDETRRQYFDELVSSSAEKRRRSTASTVVPFESLDRGNNYKRHKRNISSLDMSDKENVEEFAEYHGRVGGPLPSIEEFVRDQAADAAGAEAYRSIDERSIDTRDDTTTPRGSPNGSQILPIPNASTISELVTGDRDDPHDIHLKAARMFERIKLYFTRQIINTPNDLRIDLRAELVLHAAVQKYGLLMDGDEVHDNTESEIESLLEGQGVLRKEAVHEGEDEAGEADEADEAGGMEVTEQAERSIGQIMRPGYEAGDES